MSIRNLFFRESECKKPPTARSPAGYGLRTLFAACPASRRRLRTAVALSGLSSSSVLRTLFGGPPRFALRASDCGSPFRAVLVLGASHPFWRPAPLRVAGFGLRCRCAACSPSVLRTLFGGPPRFASRASDCGSPFRAVLVLGASHPFWQTETPDRSPGRDDSVLVSLF